MTLRELKELVDEAIKEDIKNLDCMVVMPKETDMPGMFTFQEACPGISGMITIGPSPEIMDDARGDDKQEEINAFLIAPHSMHDDDAHEEAKQKILN